MDKNDDHMTHVCFYQFPTTRCTTKLYRVTWRYEISLDSEKIFHLFAVLTCEMFSATLEAKFRISARPCNILYILLLSNLFP